MKKQRGITLIALIITIIVLLILAGVALNSIFGQGSLIGNAQNAVDEYNKKVEEEKLALEQLEEYLKNNGNTDTGYLKEIDKGADFIKVKVEDGDYESYGFSIDGGEYIETESPEYTFSNLEVTKVTGIETIEEAGKIHTIKATGKNKITGEIEKLNTIQVATEVLVESDQVQYFKYEDNGEGITITELVPFSEIVTDTSNYSNWENFFNNLQETIIVPSYIEGKPVTKVSNKFIKQVANIDTVVELNNGIEYVYSSDGQLERTKELSEVKDTIEENGGRIRTTLMSVSGGTEIKYNVISILENQISYNYITELVTDVNLRIQNGIVKNGNVNLILPPTIKEIINITYSKLNNEEQLNETISKNKLLLKASAEPGEPGEGDEPDAPEDLARYVDVILYRELNNVNINNTTIYLLGKSSNEKELLKGQMSIDWNTFTQVRVQE